ncbi:MAG TPA: VOC family protein [Miltoncostaeaceae bacterium]|nr:VOC family protein [Miltoncostaeaceae bacterium]
MPETVIAFNGAFPIVPYPDPRAAIGWLERTFGGVATEVHPPDSDEPLVHAEVRVGTGIVMLSDTTRAGDNPFCLPGPVAVYVVVDDPDALHERAVGAGVEIVRGLEDQPYGSRDFAARDHNGNVWSFGTYRPAGGSPAG